MSTFLQTGPAERDLYIYVVLPREYSRHGFQCLPLTAAYEIVNANAKWQQHSDTSLRSLGFKQLVYVPQFFFKKVNGKRALLAVKRLDDMLLSGTTENLKR